MAFRGANLELTRITSSGEVLNTPARHHIQRLAKSTERLFAQNIILEKEKDALKEVVTARKKHLSGKRGAIKGKHVLTTAEIYTRVREAEEITRLRKAPRVDPMIDPARRGTPSYEESSEEEEKEIRDCIIVAQ